jgi:LysM repeat protein
MNSRFKSTIYLLVMALLVVGLAACEQSYQERESEATEAAEGPEATAPAAGSEETPEPGQTVVSAVTPETETPGGAEEQPTQVPAIDTPGSSEPQATQAPAPTQAPSAPEQPPAQGEGSVIFHTVQPGDTLYSIARQYDTTAQAISRINGLANPDQIVVGQQLKIPTASGGNGRCRIRHTVKQGEWVWQIARNYGVDPYSILAANGLTVQSADPIYPGTILCIP